VPVAAREGDDVAQERGEGVRERLRLLGRRPGEPRRRLGRRQPPQRRVLGAEPVDEGLHGLPPEREHLLAVERERVGSLLSRGGDARYSSTVTAP